MASDSSDPSPSANRSGDDQRNFQYDPIQAAALEAIDDYEDSQEDQEVDQEEQDDEDDEEMEYIDDDDDPDFVDEDDATDMEGELVLDLDDVETVRELVEMARDAQDDDDGDGDEGDEEEEGDDDDDDDGFSGFINAEDAEGGTTRLTLSRMAFARLITQQGGLRNIMRAQISDEADDGEHTRGYGSLRRRPQRGSQGAALPKIPSDAGRELMESGKFGTNERTSGTIEMKKKLASRIMKRELGLETPGQQRSLNRLALQDLIPSSNADTIIHYDHRCYSGQFSDDGNFFFSCSQDFRVRMYDTSNPYNWKYYKTAVYNYGQWTITDASLSPDNRFLAYSSIKSIVNLASTDPADSSDPIPLDFAEYGGGRLHRGRFGHSSGHFGIWSIRFSGDGRELVAGTSDNSVYAYDIETRQTVLRIRGHEDDVNAVCYGDKMSPHLLYSGADDTMLKVWDRRSMSDNREAGVFFGHLEGLTYVDSKGDGRYILSNSKDQTMKLWDLRKMMSTEQSVNVDHARYMSGFDYRFQDYDLSDYAPHPHDCSVVTFRGHKVLKTLIRCHFSPPGSTDSRYVYSGSEDGSVYIYNLDATLAGRLDVTRATMDTRPRSDDEISLMTLYASDPRRSGAWKTCVRDASWHPYMPCIAATAWNGYGMHNGSVTLHTYPTFPDDDEAGRRVDAKLQHDPTLYEESIPRRRGMARATRNRRTAEYEDDD